MTTALAKIERGASRDVEDVLLLVAHHELQPEDLRTAFEDVVSRLSTESLRVDEEDYRRKFEALWRLIPETHCENR